MVTLTTRTHSYFLSGDSYIDQCVKMLKASGYTGIYNLELYPDRWAKTPERSSRARVEETITSLADCCGLTSIHILKRD